MSGILSFFGIKSDEDEKVATPQLTTSTIPSQNGGRRKTKMRRNRKNKKKTRRT